jgi:hypothetical protein
LVHKLKTNQALFIRNPQIGQPKLAFVADQMLKLFFGLGIVHIKFISEKIGLRDHVDGLHIFVTDVLESKASGRNVLDQIFTRDYFEHIRPDFGRNTQEKTGI